MTYEEKIKQWKELKKSKKHLDKRIKDLRKDIVDSFFLLEGRQYGINLQERDRTTYDEEKVWHRMTQRGIEVVDFTRRVVDDSKVEQLYYEGRITDDDLRFFRKPQHTYALVEQEPENVQE